MNETPTHKSTQIAKSHKPIHKPKLGKEYAFPNAERNSFFFSLPSEKIKTPDTQTDTTKTVIINNDNGLRTRWTRTPAGNRRLAQWRVKWLIEHSTSHQLWWCIDSLVLRNPSLRQTPKR